MNTAVRASLFAGGFLAVMITSADFVSAASNAGGSARTINDSLVQNLSCQNLSVNTIYRAIREDAFAESRNMDIVNWAYSSGGFTLANCWGLSSTQRMLSYMARYNESSNISKEARRELVLNMVRRAVPAVQGEAGSTEKGNRTQSRERVVNRNLKAYSVFPVEGSTVVDSYDFWWDLRAGYDMSLSKKYTVRRSLREDVQVNQTEHFYRMSNVGMGLGSGATSSKDNYESLKTMMRNADGKRLTLINLRLDRTLQHIVMVKSYKKTGSGDVVFTVYDSNQPKLDQEVIYDSRSGAFTAPGIARSLYVATKPIGVFIVDEDERELYEVAMLKHYRSVCK
jgi:hypothetical protein